MTARVFCPRCNPTGRLIRYHRLADAKLCALVRDRDEPAFAALLHRRIRMRDGRLRPYREVIVGYQASQFYAPSGSDHKDLHQVALIGFWEAARDYKPGNGDVSFYLFAHRRIQSKLRSHVKGHRAHKHWPLNTAIGLHEPVYGEDQLTVSEMYLGKESNPEDDNPTLNTVIEREQVQRRVAILKAATPRQKAAAAVVVNGRAQDDATKKAWAALRRKLVAAEDEETLRAA
jgi:Sigma-70 region 2